MTKLSSSLQDDSASIQRSTLVELKERLRDGEAARVEDLLVGNPRIADDDEAVLELIMVEMATRGRRGETVSIAEWDERLGALVPDADRRGAIRRVLSSEMATLSEAAPDAASPSPRVTLARIGKYQILEEIGRGGMGVVYKARQMNPNRIVALKMILAGEHAGPRERTRLRNEAEAAAQIAHPNIVQIIESGEHEGLPFLAMEYVDGGNLTRMLRSTPQPIRWASRLTETLARAIHVAHQAGIVHRDLNPTNVLMTQKGAPKIGDFGLAKFLLAPEGVSQNGVMLGTPSYMAPEQITNGGRNVDARTDVYALGAVLYELLTGSPPFRGLTPMETLCQVAEGEVVPPSKIRRGLPPDLETICLKCLERNPAQRYSSARALADDLRRFQDRQPIRARRASRGRRALQWAQREPLAAGLLALCVTLLVSLVSFAALYAVNLRDFGRELERQSELLNSSEYMLSISKRTMEREESLSQRRWRDLELGRIHELARLGEIQVGLELFDRLGPAGAGADDFASRYVDRLLRRSALVLGGQAHLAPVESLAVSRDGRTLVSGDAEGQIVRWSLGGERPLPRRLTTAGPAPIRALALDCDEAGAVRAIAAVGVDEEGAAVLNIWDATDEHDPWTFRHTMSEVADLMFSPDGRWLAFRLRTDDDPEWRARLYKLEDDEWLEAPGPTVEPTTRLLFSPTANLLAMGRVDGSIRTLDPSGGTERTLQIPAGALARTLAFSGDGALLAAGCDDRGVLVWDVASGTIVASFADLHAPAESLAFLLDDKSILVREGTRTVSLLDLQTPTTRREVKTRGRETTLAAVSPSGRRFALGFANDRSELWDGTDLAAAPRPLGQLEGAASIAFGPGGRSVFVNHHEALTFMLKIVPDPDPLRKLAGHAREVRAVAFSPDGEILASGGDDHQIKLWDVASGAERFSVTAHARPISGLAFSPETGELASVCLDGSLRIWEIIRDPLRPGASLRLVRELVPPNPSPLLCAAYSRDGVLLAVSGESPEILVFDRTKPGPPVIIPKAHQAAVPALAFAPIEPPLLATASRDATLKIWEPLEGLCLDAKRVNGPLLSLAYSPDVGTAPNLLAAAGERRIVNAWDTRNRNEAAPARGHPRAIRSIAFSPSGLMLATGCDDGVVRLCDSVTSQIVLTLWGHISRVNATAFSPDGSVLASCGGGGEVFLWRATPSLSNRIIPRS